MCDIDLEPCTVWRETPRKARKERECGCCGTPIRPGDPYLSHFSIYDGEATSDSVCFACWWIRESFAQSHGQSMQPDALEETLRSCIDEDGRESDWRPEMASLLKRERTTRRGRDHLRRMWERRAEREAPPPADH